MNTNQSNPTPKPKVDNNALFAQRLISNPPEYNIGDRVNTNYGIAFITGRVFSEKDNNWKYTVSPYCLNGIHVDNVTIYK